MEGERHMFSVPSVISGLLRITDLYMHGSYIGLQAGSFLLYIRVAI